MITLKGKMLLIPHCLTLFLNENENERHNIIQISMFLNIPIYKCIMEEIETAINKVDKYLVDVYESQNS